MKSRNVEISFSFRHYSWQQLASDQNAQAVLLGKFPSLKNPLFTNRTSEDYVNHIFVKAVLRTKRIIGIRISN